MGLMFAAAGIRRVPIENRYAALLRATKAIAASEACGGMADTFTRSLREVISLDYLHFVGFEQDSGRPACCLLEANGQRLGCSWHNRSPQKSPIDLVFESQEPLVTDDWSNESAFPEHRQFLQELGILSTCTLPVVNGQRRVGDAGQRAVLQHGELGDEVPGSGGAPAAG